MTRYLIGAAVVLMGIGMILVYAGVIGNGMIIPGAALTAIGIVLAALAGIVSVLKPSHAVNADAEQHTP
jgi:hypothetical protein